MKVRLAVLLGSGVDSQPIKNLALGSLTKQTDRYAETALYGLALTELARSESVQIGLFNSLPIKVPDFIRREPPIYDQLASIGSGSRRWLRAVNHLAQVRMVESAIGWLVGASAALAILGGELIDGLSSLPLLAVLPLVIIECLITSAWMGLRLADAKKRDRLSHLVVSLTTAIALVALVTNPAETELSLAPGMALVLMLTLIIDVVMAATDKADLLNRLNGD